MTKTEAINILELYNPFLGGDDYKLLSEAMDIAVKALKSQPEQSSEIQDILDYLDTVLHPIISPDHWNVYSELHDMISMFPSAQPEKRTEERTETHACDLISRQAVIDLWEKYHPTIAVDAVGYDKALRSIPSTEPEIIYCKDCKWYGRADKRRFYRGMDCLQHRIDTIVPDKDFCSKAERRIDD